MYQYTVRIDGAVVGTRKSPRPYSHAIVVQRAYDDRVLVKGYARTEELALKAARSIANKTWGVYTSVVVVPVEVREIKPRAPRAAEEVR
jgi:hypothetical protein